jgi:hypothetical protein
MYENIATKTTKWFIHVDDKNPDPDTPYTITSDPRYEGWNTNSGCPGYGLPKQMAEELCEILNKHPEFSWKLNKYGDWKK